MIVHPSLLFLCDPTNPQAFIDRTVFLGTAKPSTTYTPWLINTRAYFYLKQRSLFDFFFGNESATYGQVHHWILVQGVKQSHISIRLAHLKAGTVPLHLGAVSVAAINVDLSPSKSIYKVKLDLDWLLLADLSAYHSYQLGCQNSSNPRD